MTRRSWAEDEVWVDHWQKSEIADLFCGKSVVEAKREGDVGLLTLSDGVQLEVIPNEGGCCGGWYELKNLSACENIITSAKVEEGPALASLPKAYKKGSKKKKTNWVKAAYEDGHVYRLFVLAEDRRISLIDVEGDDGSGRYGSGFALRVRKA